MNGISFYSGYTTYQRMPEQTDRAVEVNSLVENVTYTFVSIQILEHF